MTHDEFLESLTEGEDMHALRPAAREHAETCRDCARLLEALEVLATPGGPLDDAPSADRRRDLDRELAARLGKRARRGSWATVLRAAAAVAFTAGGLWIALRALGPHEPPSGEIPPAMAEALASEPSGVIDAAAAVATPWPADSAAEMDDLFDGLESTSSGVAARAPFAGGSELMPEALLDADAVDALSDELGAALTAPEARDLVLRLHAGTASLMASRLTRLVGALMPLAVLASSPPPSAAGPPVSATAEARPRESAEPADGALREALRDYYVRSLIADLELTGDEARVVEPRVRELMQAQREANGRRAASVAELRRLEADGGDAARASELVRRAQVTEREAMQRLAMARTEFMSHLTPRQSVRFLAFEAQFKGRVREMAAERGGRPGRPPAGPPQAPGRGRRAGRAWQDEPDTADDGDRTHEQDVIDTLEIVLLHQLRTRLQLTRDETIALAPEIHVLVDTQVSAFRERRAAVRALRRAGRQQDASDATLAHLVADLQAVEAKLPETMGSARQRVIDQLTPVNAARFLLIEESFWRDAPRRIGELRSSQPGPQAGPGGGAGSR